MPDDLLRRAKQKAAADGRTLTSLIEEGLRFMLSAKPEAPGATRRDLPRVSKATGGLMPGIDPITINSQTQEMDDIEMMQRVGRMPTKP